MRTRDISAVFIALIFVVLVGFAISYIYQGGGAERTSAHTHTVLLYYPNTQQAPADVDACSEETVQPVEISLEAPGDALIQETLQALFQRSLSADEIQAGYSSSFPHPDFALQKATITDDGVLTLTFPEVPGFTSGGSCRMRIMRTQIVKTALQFDRVTDVRIRPETIFQP